MLGRRGLAAATGLGTLVLLVLLGSAFESVWLECVVLLWWAVLVAHGWFLAGGRTRRAAVRRQRVVAVCVTVPVLLLAGLLRFDAHRIEESVDEARDSGDCARALDAQDGVWFANRVADAPAAVRGDETVRACRRLAEAGQRLTTGLTGDTEALSAGFDGLAAVLEKWDGHERMAGTVLDGFLGGLPAKDPCDTVAVTEWLRKRNASHDTLDRSAGAVPRTAPAALVGCGDDLMADHDWKTARTRYEQLLDRYPDYKESARTRARAGARKATLALELAHVRGLLGGSGSGAQPEYCDRPAKYSGAPAYGKGVNRALFYGNDTYTGKLPGSWRTDDAEKAVLVVCAGEKKFGASVRTCPYENKIGPGFPTDVTFRRIAIPVKVYELRTGRLVADRKVEIGGTSCPQRLSYTTHGPTDFGPPSEVYVKASDGDVRDAFRSLVRK
ncbi:hypothetical protein DVA86_26640 [Streptomyces armeniacus]|uniref:Tetratricopeptide repeat protein n=2 Tax=Streptomyces armeniacus TaxID=83291 RepID=A0A345XVL5_9ACTN|nr:hypothetical protein DVA86_26640 [Streptomyces armeniacus]